ncbi:hypothetical protein N9C07_05645 [Flavobacteriaceae bacterium]|nr:hypothetical protein [Flavobacteriaceae bacterium]MDC1542181.1 hypothetical protein [Flavobacteriaceae bacterium]
MVVSYSHINTGQWWTDLREPVSPLYILKTPITLGVYFLNAIILALQPIVSLFSEPF